jgi:hypothetical protein
LFYRRRLPDLRLGVSDQLTGYPLVSLDAIGRLTLHNNQLLPYTLKEDGYSDLSDRNGALGLVTAEFFNKKALLMYNSAAPFVFSSFEVLGSTGRYYGSC